MSAVPENVPAPGQGLGLGEDKPNVESSDDGQEDKKVISEDKDDSKGVLEESPLSTDPAAVDNDLESLMNTKLQTISQYMALVENKKHHTMLLKENTITGFLVLCLGDEIPAVVESSLEVFRALSKHEENLPLIKGLDYIMDALRCVASNIHVKSDVRKHAKNIIAELKSLSLKDHAPLTELSDSMKNVILSTTSNNCASASATDGKEANKKPTDLNTTMMSTMKRKNKGRETVLFLENGVIQNKTERAKVTQVLIGVPGIISVTYDIKKSFCIIRGKRHVASEEFGQAVASLGLSNVYLVRKNENKEEVQILIEGTGGKENMLYPAYPEEQENDEIDNSAAVAKNDQFPSDDTSFFKSAKNFIKRSFYW